MKHCTSLAPGGLAPQAKSGKVCFRSLATFSLYYVWGVSPLPFLTTFPPLLRGWKHKTSDIFGLRRPNVIT